jgi:hypothetical protein
LAILLLPDHLVSSRDWTARLARGERLPQVLSDAKPRSPLSAGFSISGLTSIFAGAFWPVIGLVVAFELGKLSVVAWLGQRNAARALRLACVALVAVLMVLNSVVSTAAWMFWCAQCRTARAHLYCRDGWLQCRVCSGFSYLRGWTKLARERKAATRLMREELRRQWRARGQETLRAKRTRAKPHRRAARA